MCQWNILWLDHINTNVAPQLALFDRLVHITRHLHNSASWDYVESLPPAGMCWFLFHNCQLLPKVHLKDICFVVSVCYIKQKTSWDAALSCNRTSILLWLVRFYFFLFFGMLNCHIFKKEQTKWKAKSRSVCVCLLPWQKTSCSSLNSDFIAQGKGRLNLGCC